MAVAALVLGILSILVCIIPGVNLIAPFLGLAGIALSIISRKKLKESGEATDIATGGLVTSIIGTILGSIIFLACAACATTTGMMMKEATKSIQINPTNDKMGKEFQKKLDEARKQHQ